MAEDSLTAEEKFRLLLAISEAANSRLELSSVLEEVAAALDPSFPVDAVAVTTVDGEFLVPHALHIRGVEHREGDSFADVVARWLLVPPEGLGARYSKRVPLAG